LKAVFSPDGGHMAVLSTPNYYSFVYPLPLDPQQPPVTLEGGQLAVHNGGLAFSAYDSVLGITEGGYVTVYNPDDGQLLYRKKFRYGMAVSLAFAPNAPLVMVGNSDGMLECHNYREQRRVISLQGHWKEISGIQYDPEGGRVISVGLDGLVNIWHVDGLWQPAP